MNLFCILKCLWVLSPTSWSPLSPGTDKQRKMQTKKTISDCSSVSPLTQRNPVFGQLSPSEEAVKVPSWQRGWEIRDNFLHWGAFLPCRTVWYPPGIWNEHSSPPANSTPWNTSEPHSTRDGSRFPCPIFLLTLCNGGFLLFVLCWVFYLMDSLVCMRNTLLSPPDLHKAQSTHKAGCDLALQDGNCQHLWHMSWSSQLCFVTVSRFSPALKTVRSS